MRRRLVALLAVALLGLAGCGDDEGTRSDPTTTGSASESPTDPTAWEVAEPRVAEAAEAAYGREAVDQAIALATHVAQTGTYRSDLLPPRTRKPAAFTFLDDAMTAAGRRELRRLARRALADGATPADVDALRTFAFWSVGNETWQLRTDLEPAAVHPRITSTRVRALDEGVLGVTQRINADLHVTVDGEPRLVALGKTVTWQVVDTDRPAQGDWGGWRLDAWDGRTTAGEPREDPS